MDNYAIWDMYDVYSIDVYDIVKTSGVLPCILILKAVTR